jgi:hypothetical protein
MRACLSYTVTEIIKKTAQVADIVNQVDALNYMAYLGWEVVHLAPFETDSDGGTTKVTST